MSEVKVNKISPRSGTDVTLGDSSDTFTVPSGATLTTTNATVNLPASVGGLGTGIDVTSQITGVVPTANLGSGSASSSVFLSGASTWIAAGGGNLELITATTASDTATIDFTSGFDAAYDVYRLDITQAIPTDDGAYPTIALSDDAGVSWEAGAGDYRAITSGWIGSNAASGTTTSTGDHYGTVLWTNTNSTTKQGNQVAESLNGSFWFYGLNDGNNPGIRFQYSCGSTGGFQIGIAGYGCFTANTNVVNGIRFLNSSVGGNVATGEFRLFGIKNS